MGEIRGDDMSRRGRSALDKLIDKFLAESRKSDGGWAPVTERDLGQLYIIVEKIIGMKWGQDPDGDLPIEWKIIDRTRFERLHYFPVPYEHKAKDELALEHLSTVVTNANIANDELSTTLRVLQNKLREKKPKKQHEG
jgi:hypothetical protein